MLIHTPDGAINTDHIVEISESWDNTKKTHKCHVRFSDGTKTFVEMSVHDILDRSGNVIQNDQGFAVVMTEDDSNRDESSRDFWTIPVLAFRVTGQFGMPSPITVEGELINVKNPWALLSRDGKCFFEDGETSDSITDWIKYLNFRRSLATSTKA